MKKVVRSFAYAFKGLAFAARSQLNFRIHLFFAFAAIVLAWVLHIRISEWLWIALCITIVLITEVFNTMIETLTDLVSPAYNIKAGYIKDMSAGAVVVAAFFALLTGIIIFLPKLLLLFGYAF